MKYYVFETEVADGQQAFLTTPKEDYNEAKMLYHQILASAYANEKVTYALVMIIDEGGLFRDRELYTKGTPNASSLQTQMPQTTTQTIVK